MSEAAQNKKWFKQTNLASRVADFLSDRLRMDVIAGFPGESDEEFIDSVERLRSLPWTRLHVFPYSARPGTFAARRADPVANEQIRRRAEILRDLSQARFEAAAGAQVGQLKSALVLRNGGLLTRDYWTVEAQGVSARVANEEVRVHISGTNGTSLLGHVEDQLASRLN